MVVVTLMYIGIGPTGTADERTAVASY